MRLSLSAICIAGALSCASFGTASAAPLGIVGPQTTAERILGGDAKVEYSQWRGRRGWRGRGYGYRGGYRGRYYGRRGYYRNRNRGAAIGAGVAGLAAGALIGGAIASQAAPARDAVAYCSQRFKSYDPASGTYLGYDGKRHACP